MQAYDPMADWSELPPIPRFRVCESAHEAAMSSNLLVILTEWAEFVELDFAAIAAAMDGSTILDTKGVLRGRAEELRSLGLEIRFLGVAPQHRAGDHA